MPRGKKPEPAHASGSDPVDVLPGVGPSLAIVLEKLGLTTVQDLWFHLPLRYEDRTRITSIRDLRAGETALVEGRIEAIERGFRWRPQLRIAVTDSSQQTLILRFFHFSKAQTNQLLVGTRLRAFGDVRFGAQGLEMVHPQYQRLADEAQSVVEDRLTPIYPTTEGLSTSRLATLIERALTRLPIDDELELIPEPLHKVYKLSSLRDALLYVHRPPPDADVASLVAGQHSSQQRLAFEELLAHHLSLKRLRERIRRHSAIPLRGDGSLRAKFLEQLPFEPTRAQQRVSIDVENDIAKSKPMLRLVQGDVGSGKTVVAALAALNAVECGAQAALMAPTELLAEQHFANFKKWMTPLGVEVAWLGGKSRGRARDAMLARIATDAGIVIGTHALMQEGVVFRKLGLAIIDEQHRFGVHQRLALRDKGRSGDAMPHQLVLTATPIPRTLAMTAYADLDVSAIDELPPGRTPVATVALNNARRGEIVDRIRKACAEGRQAYWVCTVIEESDVLQAQAAEVAYNELRAALPDLNVGCVHGRLKPAEKQGLMDAFKSGEIKLLVATTVIEVGVDVPNASLMVIENSERLGLAQLHQLRGRVGRGSEKSSCVLLYQAPLSLMARHRLDVLRQTNDGFQIAEKDLELRGPGELLGTRQAGQMALRIGDIARDAALLPLVQQAGAQLLRDHPQSVDPLIARWIGQAARYAGA